MIVRSDSLQGLEPQGWEEVEAHDFRTVVDLRNESKIGADVAARPESIETVRVPLDVTEDREFWDAWESGLQFEEDQAPALAEFLRSQGTTATELIVETLTTFDVEATLLAAGLAERDVAVLRQRFFG